MMNFLQIVILVFILGLGIGASFYILTVICMDKLNYLTQIEIRKSVHNAIVELESYYEEHCK